MQELGLHQNASLLSCQCLLSVEAEDKTIQVSHPTVIATLDHGLHGLRHIDSTCPNAGSEATEAGISCNDLFVVLKQ